MTASNELVTLYGYYRSSCSARLRIALELKSIPYRSVFVNIKDGFHLQEEYAAINPSRTVPSLEIGTAPALVITQSVAALDYLEEAFADTTPLLPPRIDTAGRVQVRIMVNIISNDIQPVTNMKVLKRATALGYDAAKWARDFMAPGFAAYEAIARETAGKYSYGNSITMADVCLAPAMWNAERYELDLGPYPKTREIYENVSLHPSFRAAHWQKQPDCPEELR